MDIRFTMMEQGEAFGPYPLPMNAFLYTKRGDAQIWVDKNRHLVQSFHAFHAGKGVCIQIVAEKEFDYFLIFYKTTLPLPNRQEIVALLENDNPFQYQYAFAPANPLTLLDKVEQMNTVWLQPNEKELKRLHIKALFYQYIYELLRQMHNQGIHPIKPDIVTEAVRYIEEHYQRPLTLEKLAQELSCSVGYLSKLFKEKMHTSPIH